MSMSFWLEREGSACASRVRFYRISPSPETPLSKNCAGHYWEALYRGDLLEGWYSDWCLYERERLQHMYLAMLDKLMEYSESHQEYETGQTYGMRALRYDR